MKMNLHCFANLIPIMILALFSNSGLINATEVGKRTDALEASAWNESKWISAVDAPIVKGHNNGRAADGASWFVSTVKNEQKIVSAKWMTAGLGVYELYVNGKPVGGEFLKPGFTHYAKTKRSFTYDITDIIRTKPNAENMLSVQVTPGWWADKIITPGGYDGMIGKKCAFRGVLELTFSDGSKKRYGTDLENWKAGIAGPVKHAGIFDGEEYDAREPMGFECVDKLSIPEENTEFSGDILPSDGAEVYLRTDLALAPIRAYIWKNIEGAKENEFGKVIIAREFASGKEMTISPGETLVVDFGQNCAGVPSFVFKAAEGTVLTCLPAELLNDGNGAKIRGMDGPEGSCHRVPDRQAVGLQPDQHAGHRRHCGKRRGRQHLQLPERARLRCGHRRADRCGPVSGCRGKGPGQALFPPAAPDRLRRGLGDEPFRPVLPEQAGALLVQPLAGGLRYGTGADGLVQRCIADPVALQLHPAQHPARRRRCRLYHDGQRHLHVGVPGGLLLPDGAQVPLRPAVHLAGHVPGLGHALAVLLRPLCPRQVDGTKGDLSFRISGPLRHCSFGGEGLFCAGNLHPVSYQ